MSAHRPCLALSLVCLLAASSLLAEGALYDRTRGFKTYNLPEEHTAEFLKQHDASTIIGKMKQREELKEHPEVKAFLDWKQKYQDGHPDAGAAFAGKIPHDFIPMMTHHGDEHRMEKEL